MKLNTIIKRLQAPKTVFHVGLPKTGSTALRVKAMEKLNAQVAHSEWRSISSAVRQSQPVDMTKVFAPEDEARLRILTHESMVAVEPEKLAVFVKESADNPHILLITRNPNEWVRSYYLQQVRLRKESRRFPKWYGDNKVSLRRRMNYDRYYSSYCDVLGKKAVTFLPYEMMRNDPARFSQILSKLFDQPVHISMEEGYQENKSLSPKEAELARRFNLAMFKGTSKYFEGKWGVDLRRAVSRFVDHEQKNPFVQKLVETQSSIFRADWEKAGHLPEIWGKNTFVNSFDWYRDYAAHYDRAKAAGK